MLNPQNLLTIVTEKGIISEMQKNFIAKEEKIMPFSIHHELRIILYLGIFLFTTGLGTLVYKNIDTIGHDILVGLLSILTLACFIFAYKYRQKSSWQEIKNPSKLVNYILLLGCLSFLILEGYLQYQYTIFGEKYGLAMLFPAVLFTFCAYFFDNQGVLSLGLSSWASFFGLSIAPFKIAMTNYFTQPKLIITAIVFGFVLLLIGYLSEIKNLKKHFTETYLLLGGNLIAIAALIGLTNHHSLVSYSLILAILCGYFIYYAREKHSFLFLLMSVIYGYITFTYLVFHNLADDFWSLGIYYFLFSSIGVVFFFLNFKKILAK